MAATETQAKMGGSVLGDEETQMTDSSTKRGGWITFSFIIATMTATTVAGGGWMSNLIVYLIQEFNVKSIDAAQVSNVVNGCTSLFPVAGAIIADSFLGCFSVISISTFISLLGILLLGLTATLNSLKPPPCEDGSSLCTPASKFQIAVLYAGITLASIGLGGSRYTIATMGANQFDKPKDQGIFFNWYFFSMYASSVVSATAIVYIEDNVSWSWGFGLCFAANFVGLVIFLVGSRFYRHTMPKASPFSDIARVIVATVRKWKVPLPANNVDYLQDHDGSKDMVPDEPTKRFGFLNRAALRTQDDIQPDGSIGKSWRLCTVQQVEDLKTIIKIMPLWSTSIFLGTPIGIQSSLTILQALAMDRHIGPHFKIPAGSILVFVLISTSIFITLIDRFLCPTWKKLTSQSPTPLQLIGVGHVLNVLSMGVSALVESKRLKVARAHDVQAGLTVPMLAMWLFPQLALVGIGEAFHFPGQVALYYQEFPEALRSTATAMIAMIVGISFYLSTALIDLIRRVTGWLPDDINNGRVDNVYWILVVVGIFNFGYYLICAKLYKYQNIQKGNGDTNGVGPSGKRLGYA